MELKFNVEDWIKILSAVHLKQTDEETMKEFSPSYKKDCIIRNEEKKIFTLFLVSMKQKKIENAHQINYNEIIECPKTKNGLMAKTISGVLARQEHADLYCNLLKNNNIPLYQELVEKLTTDHHNHRKVYYPHHLDGNGESYLNIFRHAILMCPPADVQNTFDHLYDQYVTLEKIDSKEETKEKMDRIMYDFHKSLRQTDTLGNAHAEMIIWELLQFSEVPLKAIRAVIEHVKENKKQKA